MVKLPPIDYSRLAEDELDRADAWANKENVEASTRKYMVDRFMERAMVYSLLSIAQEIKKFSWRLSDGSEAKDKG